MIGEDGRKGRERHEPERQHAWVPLMHLCRRCSVNRVACICEEG